MKKLFKFFSLLTAFLFLISATIYADGFNSIYTTDGNYVIAVGDQGNVFRSLNGGNSWAKYTHGSINFKSVFVLGNDIWATSADGKVYKSSTNSMTFMPYDTPVNTSINGIYFLDANNGFVCGDNSAVFKSVNGGMTWTQSNTGISAGVKLNSIHFKDAQNGIAVGSNGSVYLTANGGSSWTSENISTTKNLLDAKYFADGIVVCGEWGVLSTKPNAQSWSSVQTRINTDIRSISGTAMSDAHVCGGGGFIRNNQNGNLLFANFEKNPMLANLVDIIYSGNTGFAVSSLNNAIIRTVNGGQSWELPSGTSVNYNWVSKPGASGNFLGNNLCLNPNDRNAVYIAFANKVYRSADKGESWYTIGNQIPSGNTPHSFYVSPLDTNIWLVAIESSPDKVYRSTDYGFTWNQVISQNFSNYGQPLEMDQNNPHVFYFAPDNGGFYKSTDDGATFTEISNNYPFRSPCDILVAWDEPNTIYLADGTTGSGQGKLFKSVNGGVNWVEVHSNPTSSEIPSMSNTVFDKTTVWVTEWPGPNIYKSTNSGTNFSIQHANGNTSGWGSDICREDPTIIVTGSWGASAFLTVNGGTNWTNVSNGLSGHGGGILIPDRGFIICHQGSNVYKLNVVYSVVTSVSENIISSVPQEFSLSQNYPNPFNPSTKIQYTLPKAGNVSVKVYNELGEEVSTLVNSYKNAGSYELTFDASALSSGMYFYKLQSEGFVTTKKMMLVK